MSNVATESTCTCGASDEAARLNVSIRYHADSCALSRLRVDDVDRAEARDRARTVSHILERCTQELERLENIPHLSTDELEAMSMAKGFCARAMRALGRFQ